MQSSQCWVVSGYIVLLKLDEVAVCSDSPQKCSTCHVALWGWRIGLTYKRSGGDEFQCVHCRQREHLTVTEQQHQDTACLDGLKIRFIYRVTNQGLSSNMKLDGLRQSSSVLFNIYWPAVSYVPQKHINCSFAKCVKKQSITTSCVVQTQQMSQCYDFISFKYNYSRSTTLFLQNTVTSALF